MRRSEREHGVWAAFVLAIASLAGCANAGSGEPDSGSGDGTASASGVPADTAAWYRDRLMQSLGGERAWERTRYLSFRWIVEREGQVV